MPLRRLNVHDADRHKNLPAHNMYISPPAEHHSSSGLHSSLSLRVHFRGTFIVAVYHEGSGAASREI